MFKVYIDQGVDQPKIKSLSKEYKFQIVQAHSTEKKIAGARSIARPFTIGVSLLDGTDKIADENIHTVNSIIGKNNRADITHIYSAYMEPNCRYFVTNNPKDFIYESKRVKHSHKKRIDLEKSLPNLKIFTLKEFETELKKGNHE